MGPAAGTLGSAGPRCGAGPEPSAYAPVGRAGGTVGSPGPAVPERGPAGGFRRPGPAAGLRPAERATGDARQLGPSSPPLQSPPKKSKLNSASFATCGRSFSGRHARRTRRRSRPVPGGGRRDQGAVAGVVERWGAKPLDGSPGRVISAMRGWAAARTSARSSYQGPSRGAPGTRSTETGCRGSPLGTARTPRPRATPGADGLDRRRAPTGDRSASPARGRPPAPPRCVR
jgi:hypothetical protein